MPELMGEIETSAASMAGAFGSAFGSAITGAEGFGAALKKASGQALVGMASEMAAKAAYHAAAALGSLAIGNLGSAAMHGKSAAAYGAGAVLAGGLARALGVGGGGGSSGGGAPNLASGGGGGGGRNITIIMGDDWSDESPQMRQRRARRSIDQAVRETQTGRDGVYYG